MIAKGFKPVAWVAAIGTAALACYMLSLQVAAERSELASLENRILRTHQDIRSLQTELGTRGRLQQLEQWNAEVLALSAPVAGQFLENGLTLARFDTTQPPIVVEEEVRLAAVQTAPAPATPRVESSPVQPRVIQAAARLPASTDAGQSLVHRANFVAPSARPAPVRTTSVPARAATTPAQESGSSTRTASAQAGSSSLLDERTLRELGAQARAENAGGAN